MTDEAINLVSMTQDAKALNANAASLHNMTHELLSLSQEYDRLLKMIDGGVLSASINIQWKRLSGQAVFNQINAPKGYGETVARDLLAKYGELIQSKRAEITAIAKELAGQYE